MPKKFPHYHQYDQMDCGPACLRIISRYYGKDFSLQYLRSLAGNSRAGSNLLGLSEAAEKLGFKTMAAKVKYENLVKINAFPFICFWNQNHYVVVYKIRKDSIYISDPAHGLLKYQKKEFLKSWANDESTGVVFLLEPTPLFNDQKDVKAVSKNKFAAVLFYLKKYKKVILQLLLGLVVSSCIQLILPFITQNIVDVGIQNNNIGFIYLLLFAQLFLFIGRITVEIVRGYLLLHLSSRIGISILSDFFSKLMRLPISFFDTKMTGDILQRITDHQRVETFLTSGTLSAIFSVVNIFLFGIVLMLFDYRIFLVFLFGSLMYFMWIKLFSRKRADLDYKRFSQLSHATEKNVELIYGMQEIKLNNAQHIKKWEWEQLQINLFRLNISGLSLKQIQEDGASVLNELKNIIIIFLAAKLVVTGQISLGTMLSISYINGQLNGPILQLTQFIQNYQDASLSLERINEIHDLKDEDESNDTEKINDFIINRDIVIRNLYFKYVSHSKAPYTLENISFTIPERKVTAIVGTSGSGKTTLLKLLLKFYEPNEGEILIGDTPLLTIDNNQWRKQCGVVMQEGYLFNDTIARNIAMGDEHIDKEKLVNAVILANIFDYINTLPLRFNTRLGNNGVGLSTGQKQRILIARAIYKNPDILLFDEATSALDAETEKVIVGNLDKFFTGKTVVVIAHRLSTVKNADQIIVMDKGEIVETGNHKSLIEKREIYFNLIKNQIELGV